MGALLVADLFALFLQRAVQKEVRFIPQLIFAIEDYEKFLVRVSKKAKVGRVLLNLLHSV